MGCRSETAGTFDRVLRRLLVATLALALLALSSSAALPALIPEARSGAVCSTLGLAWVVLAWTFIAELVVLCPVVVGYRALRNAPPRFREDLPDEFTSVREHVARRRV